MENKKLSLLNFLLRNTRKQCHETNILKDTFKIQLCKIIFYSI